MKEVYTLVVWSTFARRGKSLTPESRMEMEESRSCMLERREATQPSSEFAMVS